MTYEFLYTRISTYGHTYLYVQLALGPPTPEYASKYYMSICMNVLSISCTPS